MRAAKTAGPICSIMLLEKVILRLRSPIKDVQRPSLAKQALNASVLKTVLVSLATTAQRCKALCHRASRIAKAFVSWISKTPQAQN